MLPRLMLPAHPDMLSRRRLLETWVYYARWVMLLVALPWIVALHPLLWWLWLAAAADIAFHNILRASLIHHGTIDQRRSRGALLLALDSLVLMIAMWPAFRHGQHPVQQWLLVIPLEAAPRLGFERPRVSMLVMALLTAILSGYEALGLRYHEDWKDISLWVGIFVLIGIWGSLRTRASWRVAQERDTAPPQTVMHPSMQPQRRTRPTLTRQERNVLRLVERKMTNDEIAADLSISPKTVKKHLDNVFKRLGVHDRDAAVHVAREHGYLD